MTYKGMGEMFEGDSADMCARKFPLVSMGGERRVSSAQTRERGPPSALAEFILQLDPDMRSPSSRREKKAHKNSVVYFRTSTQTTMNRRKSDPLLKFNSSQKSYNHLLIQS